MHQQLLMVKAFHEKLGVSPTKPMNRDMIVPLLMAAGDVVRISQELEPLGALDERFSRMHLIFEESGELAKAMAEGDIEGVLDALCDLLYVVLGTSVAFDLPLVEGFNEVHRSNMTKEKQSDDVAAHRIRKKGPNYSPPHLARILANHGHIFPKDLL